MAVQDDLVKQILGQGTTSQWSGAGYGSAEANAKDMARILESAGITDIKQLGKVPVYEKAMVGGYSYNGNALRVTPNTEDAVGGDYYYQVPTGESTYNYEDGVTTPIMRTIMVPKDAKIEPIYGTMQPTGAPTGDEGSGGMGYAFRPASTDALTTKDGELVVKTSESYGNKVTGQALPKTYNKQDTGDFFGGTFAGKGNTGYGVKFQPDGTPVFYTQGASSNDLFNILQDNKILNLAANVGAAAFGGPAGAAALQLAQGKDIKDAAKAAALAYAGQQVMSGFGGGTPDVSSIDTGGLLDSTGRSALDAGMDVYGGTGNIGLDGLNAGLDVFPSTGSVGLEGLDAGMSTYPSTGNIGLEGLDAGMGAYPNTGSIGLEGLDAGMGAYPTTGNVGLEGLDAGMDVYPSTGDIGLSGLDAGMDAYPSTGNIGMEGLDAGMDVYPSTGNIGKVAATAANSALSASDAIRLAGIAATLAGGAKLVSGAGGTGSGGFPIVPIPAEWTSPPPTSTATFTPLPDIDFGNKEMLRGTQWERLLSPDYGKAPPPIQYAQPSNMSFDELTRILGGSKTSVPTQNLTINDVISGIQNQYGQAPKGAVG